MNNDPIHCVNLYTIKDNATNTFGAVFESRTDEEASRMVSHLMTQRPDELLALYPQDYQLWRVAKYSKTSGEITADLEYLLPLNQLKKPLAVVA